MRLEEILIRLSEIWCEVTDRKESTLSARLANDGKMLASVRDGSFVTTGKYQHFLAWFRSGDNWPDGRIPEQAVEILDLLANIAVEAAPSTVNMDEISSEVPAQDAAAQDVAA